MRRSLALFALLAAATAGAASAEPAPGPAPVTVSATREADATTTLVHETVIAAAPPAVWEAIATPEGWMGWAVPLARFVPGEPDVLETSYDPAAPPGSAATIRHRFLARIPGRLLAFRTIKTPDGFPFGSEYLAVTSVFELAPEVKGAGEGAGAGEGEGEGEGAGEGTRLRLTSTGYPEGEAGAALVGFFSTGNEATLRQLQTLLEAPPAQP